MPTPITYKSIQVLSPDPTGAGGLLIQNNLKILADADESLNAVDVALQDSISSLADSLDGYLPLAGGTSISDFSLSAPNLSLSGEDSMTLSVPSGGNLTINAGYIAVGGEIDMVSGSDITGAGLISCESIFTTDLEIAGTTYFHGCLGGSTPNITFGEDVEGDWNPTMVSGALQSQTSVCSLDFTGSAIQCHYFVFVEGTIFNLYFSSSGSTPAFINTDTIGLQIGVNATNNKLAFWGSSPILQPASANQAAITNSTGGTASFTLAAITAPASNLTTSLTADMTAVKNALASLHRQINEMRNVLVNTGLMKGSA